MDERNAKRIEQQALRMLEIASHATTRAARADIEIAELRARLESAEGALRFYANPDNWFPGVGINRGLPCSVEADEGKRARAAFAVANEGDTG